MKDGQLALEFVLGTRATFDEVLAAGSMRLRNPHNGIAFTAHLQDTSGFISLKVIPDKPQKDKTFLKWRIMQRATVERWLDDVEKIPC